jgi:twitching motility protein PilI
MSAVFDRVVHIAQLALENAKGLPMQDERQESWEGIGFKMNNDFFVSPMYQISEILPTPALTWVPSNLPWVVGVANNRGRLLTINDLSIFFFDHQTTVTNSKKNMMVVELGEFYGGLLVDEVFGIVRFKQDHYRSKIMDHPILKTYQRGCYVQAEDNWLLFDVEALVKDPLFLRTSG